MEILDMSPDPACINYSATQHVQFNRLTEVNVKLVKTVFLTQLMHVDYMLGIKRISIKELCIHESTVITCLSFITHQLKFAQNNY